MSGDGNYGVVGQQGFFNLFTITFDLTEEEIELEPSVIGWQREGRRDRKII